MCVDKVGLSDRARVVGELARVQPIVATIAANTRMTYERLAMLSILTSSPESESQETSLEDVREPSGQVTGEEARGLSTSDRGQDFAGIASPQAPTYV